MDSLHVGGFPSWSPDGKVVSYRFGSTLLRAPVTFVPQPEIGNPVAVLDEAALPGTVEKLNNAPGGKGFITILEKKGAEPPPRVVQNWFGEVERLTAAGRQSSFSSANIVR